jgi:hypothetical protein
VSRRWRYPRSRRGQILAVLPQQSSPFAVQRRRMLAVAARRGRFLTVVPAPVAVPPPRPPDTIGHSRSRLTFARRSRPTAVALPAAQPAGFPRTRTRRLATARCGQFFSTPTSSAVVPLLIGGHRPDLVLARRGRFLAVVTAPSPVPPPRPPDWIGYHRPRPARPARSRIWVRPSQDTPPAAYRSQHRLTPRTRRGVFFTVAPAPVVVPPQRPPDAIGHGRQCSGWPRRGRYASTPPTMSLAVVSMRGRSARPARIRRGIFLPVLPAPIVAAGPVFVPSFIARHRTTSAALRRGRLLAIPPAPVAPAAPVFVPPVIARRRPSAMPTRRGRVLTQPPSLAVPTTSVYVSPPLTRYRPALVTTRHGRCFVTPPSSGTVPPRITGRRPTARVPRRGRYAACPTPSTPLPVAIRRHPQPPLATRRGRRSDPPWANPQTPTSVRFRRPRGLPSKLRHAWTGPPLPSPSRTAAIPRARRRLITPRRACFWRWSIFQADPPPLSQTDPTATETHTRRRTASETTTGLLGVLETATGRRTATEAPAGRLSATETTLDRDDA